MTASLLIQTLIAGVANGCIYALIGMGISVVFRGSQVINAMQGEFCVIAGIVAALLMKIRDWPYPLAILAGCVIGFVLGGLIEMLLVRPMIRRRASEDSFLLLTIGLAVAGSASVLYLAGRDGHLLPELGAQGVFLIADAVLREHIVWLVLAAAAIAGVLLAFFKFTTLGLAMTAAAIDADGAASNGIDVPRMRTLTFALGGLLGAVAGILLAPLYSVSFSIGFGLTLKGFAAAILGGLSNPLGAVAGGVLLGLVEALSVMSISSAYSDAIAMALLIAVMILAPHGLLGRKGRSGG
jgi:branched-chain amino acid transport system permease protein